MTDKIEFKLFRKPKLPKLERLDLKKVHSPDDLSVSSSTSTENTSENESSLSTDREIISSSFYLANNIFNKPSLHNSHSKALLPSLNSNNSDAMSKLLTIAEESRLHIDAIKSLSSSRLDDYEQKMIKKIAQHEKENFYMKKFEKNKFKTKMKTIKSAITGTTAKNKWANLSEKNSIQSSMNDHKRLLVKPRKPLGPDPLPIRPLKFHHNDIELKKSHFENLVYDNTNLYLDDENHDAFVLNDFLLSESKANIIFEENSGTQHVSSRNYTQICKMLDEKIEELKSEDAKQVHFHTIVPDVEPVENRKPMRQSMIEMASYLKNELSKKTGVLLKTKFNPVSRWQRMNGAQTELIIYQDNAPKKDEKQQSNNEENQISPTQLAIVDCLLRNGLMLSLKAHFIDTLPDLSALKKTLIYINLSFNNFKEFPVELLEMHQIEAIKMRSNPLKTLTDKISNLQNLKILVFSYCQFNEVPSCIFDLENLLHLDVSYNRIKTIDEKIVRLKNLKILNYEGNEIEYLPCSMLKMYNLKQINVKNNYLHPLIWMKMLKNNAQSLFALSATRFEQIYGESSKEFENFSFELQTKLKNNQAHCDACGGKRFEEGLQIIRPCVKIFGVKFLPFLFVCCSPKCYYSLKKNSRNSI